MERPFKCKTLKAEFEERGFALRGPCTAEFEIDAAPAIQVKITQARSRTITIESPTDIEVNRLYGILYRVETLLMIFDGKFIQLHTIELLNSEETSPEQLISCAKNYANKRLSYFYSADFCRYEINRLIDFEDIITKECFI